MNRRTSAGVSLFLTCLVLGSGAGRSSVALAACRVKTQVVATNSVAVAAVPLAVSVGVPVAEVTPYYYSYSAYSPYAPTPTIDVDTLATKLAAKLAAGGNGNNSPPNNNPPNNGPPNSGPQPAPPNPITPAKLAPQSPVAQKCAQCHSGAEPKGKLSFENPAALDCPTRLKAIRAVLSEKMPQGGPKLTPDEAGKVLEELVGQ